MRSDNRAAALGIVKLLVGAALANQLKPQLPEDVCHLLKVGSSKLMTISLLTKD